MSKKPTRVDKKMTQENRPLVSKPQDKRTVPPCQPWQTQKWHRRTVPLCQKELTWVDRNDTREPSPCVKTVGDKRTVPLSTMSNKKMTRCFRIGSCTHIKLHRSLNFSWTEASCTNIDMLRCSVNYGFNTHNVRLERSVASSVWVGHLVTEYNALSAYFTFCHNWYTSWIFLTSLIVTYKFVKCKCFLNFSLKHNNRFTFWCSDIILNL